MKMTRFVRALSLFCLIAAALCLPWQTATAQERSADEPVVVQLTLHPYGFVPPEITVDEGLIDLEIVSRVGFPELPILIERDAERNQAKQTLRNETYDARKRKWDQMMVLTPGTYTVSVAGRAQWTAKIIVTERSK